MPAKSEAQQRLMGMALSAKRGKGHFSGKVKEVAESMTEKQLHDFAKTKHEGLPEKKAMVELIKWAIANVPSMTMPASGAVDIASKTSRLSPAGFAFKRFLPGVGGITQAISASERAHKGDNVGAWIDRVGALGAGASMVPEPLTMGVGTAVNLGALGLNAWRDSRNAAQPTQQPPAPQPAPQPASQPAPQAATIQPPESFGSFGGGQYGGR
jgi:hypothetical protein